ncbi:MAG: ECF-type sigma factor [Bryobacter sp.]|nr:ECF-type sigma factor [Bryobacter sp.]
MAKQTFTQLLNRGAAGDAPALAQAYEIIHSDLHSVAARLLRREARSVTLQPTLLVNELFVRFNALEIRVASRGHFLALACRNMKQYLIDRSRRRNIRERHAPELANRAALAAPPIDWSTLAVRQALARLSSHDALACQALCLTRQSGYTIAEVARLQERPTWRVNQDCQFAEQWLRRKLSKA